MQPSWKLEQVQELQVDPAVKLLKKRKLRIKDMVATLESRLIPDRGA